MRITEIDLQCEDLVWFSVDSQGHVFECTSAGCGNVPEYVCKSRKETERLLQFFSEEAPIVTDSNLLIQDADNELVDDARLFSSKGLFCYDVTDYDNDNTYSCIAKPTTPIVVSSLPSEIQSLLKDHKYSGNVSEETTITVEHAYV